MRVVALPTVPFNYSRLLRTANATGVATATTSRGPMVLSETWAAAIDTTNVWTVTVGATGTAAVASVSGIRLLALLAPAIADTAQVNAKASLTNPVALVPTATANIYQRVVLEFEMKLTTLASIDNAQFIAGLYTGDAAGRSAANASGFILAADALNTLTDKAGVEAVTVVSPAPTLTNWNKYKHIINATSHEFYVNDVLVATHSTAANLPLTYMSAAQFYLVSDAADDPRVDIGPVRCYLEDV